MKKIYMMPSIDVTEVMVDTLMAAGSILNPDDDNQTVTPSDEEYDGEFGSNRTRDPWRDGECSTAWSF